jgi:NAD+ synthase
MNKNVLDLSCEAEVTRICDALVSQLSQKLRRRGLVLGLSGGVDSSVCAALAARAVGPQKVYAVLMPEQDSSGASVKLGRAVAEQLKLPYEVVDLAPALEALGCYRMRDEAIRRVVPDYAPDWKSKIVISGGLERGINFFRLVAQSPQGQLVEKRLPHKDFLQIVAAQNYKQRLRKTVEFFHGDRLHYAVIGTPNRLEYDQGFFVKNGDGSADVKPIAHLYKTQVYALARHLGLPAEICNSQPSTDTYSLPQGQDEFYFALPYDKMDLALWALNHAVPAAEVAPLIGLTETQALLVYKDIETKRETTRYLHSPPLLVEKVQEVRPL